MTTVDARIAEVDMSVFRADMEHSDPTTTPARWAHLSEAEIVASGTAPSIASVTFVADDVVRLTFDQPMSNDAAFNTASNYTFTPLDGDSVAVTVLEAAPGPGDFPIYVDLTLNKALTIGTSNYTVKASGVKSAASMLISGSPVTFNGNAARATISARSFPGNLTLVQITYSRPVKQVNSGNPDDALNPDNYSITGGVTVNSVASVNSKTVNLSVSGEVSAHTYVVTVTGVEDTSNNEVA